MNLSRATVRTGGGSSVSVDEPALRAANESDEVVNVLITETFQLGKPCLEFLAATKEQYSVRLTQGAPVFRRETAAP